MPIKNRTQTTTLTVEYTRPVPGSPEELETIQQRISIPATTPEGNTCEASASESLPQLDISDAEPNTQVKITQDNAITEGNFLIIKIEPGYQPVEISFTYPGGSGGDAANVTVGEDQ